MSTIFMNLRNSKASDAHKLRLNLIDKIDLQRGCNSATLSNIMMDLIPYHEIQNYFEYIIKKHETFTDKPPVKAYVSRIQNSITFKIKSGYYLELLTTQNMT